MNHGLLQKLLDYYQINYDQYLNLNKEVSLSTFSDGMHFEQIESAIKLVREIQKNNGKILIYGDYDADGIMGTSILVKMFQYTGYIVDFYLPNRYQDGYGINESKAQEFVKQNYDLIITVDNGVTAFKPIEILKENGIKVIVLDHHQPEENLPIADYIIHPIISKFSDITTSGAFTAFMFSYAYLGYFDKYLSTLAAISLISDMMPLIGFNRDFLRAVFQEYKNGEFLQIDLLSDNEPFNENTIGMKIAPRINSVGRLIDNRSINEIVYYFTNNDKENIITYFNYLISLNEERKLLTKQANDSVNVDATQPAIISIMDIKEGLLGLVANSLMNVYQKPVIIFTLDSTKIVYKGSARSPEGFNIVEAFEKLKPYLIAYGGHSSAGGCSVSVDKFIDFQNGFLDITKNKKITANHEDFIEISINDITEDNADLISSFAPFGECWKTPNLKISRIKTDSLMFSKNGEHILSQIGFNNRLVGFGFNKQKILLTPYVDMFGTIRKTFYKNNKNIEFLIKNVVSSTK